MKIETIADEIRKRWKDVADAEVAAALLYALAEESVESLEVYSLNQLREALYGVDFRPVASRELCRLELSPAVAVDDGLPELPARLKSGGQVWTIHKNDADPWPSDPHAHLEGSPYKLDLSTGVLYLKRERYTTISIKDLARIRECAEKRDIVLPPLLLDAR